MLALSDGNGGGHPTPKGAGALADRMNETADFHRGGDIWSRKKKGGGGNWRGKSKG